MNFRFRSLSLTVVSLIALAFGSGCEVSKCKTEDGRDATCAESLQIYTLDSANETKEQPYETGMDLVVDNIKGAVLIVPGDAGVVRATFVPFTYRGHSKDAEAGEDIVNGLSKDMSTSGTQILVGTTQLGSWAEVGASLTIELPPEFDGTIRVLTQGRGTFGNSNIDIDDGAVGSATMVDMESRGIGDCNLDGAPSVVSTIASCAGVIEITNVSDDVTAFGEGTILDDENGVRVSFAGISAGAGGGEIESQAGHVELNLPGDGNFVVNAEANEEGLVQINPPPDGCEATDNSVTCGTGDRIYVVSAGTDDSLDPGHVNMDFH